MLHYIIITNAGGGGDITTDNLMRLATFALSLRQQHHSDEPSYLWKHREWSKKRKWSEIITLRQKNFSVFIHNNFFSLFEPFPSLLISSSVEATFFIFSLTRLNCFSCELCSCNDDDDDRIISRRKNSREENWSEYTFFTSFNSN